MVVLSNDALVKADLRSDTDYRICADAGARRHDRRHHRASRGRADARLRSRECTVTANSPSQSAASTTDASGTFRFLTLAPDTYTLSFSQDGIRPGNAARPFRLRRPGANLQRLA